MIQNNMQWSSLMDRKMKLFYVTALLLLLLLHLQLLSCITARPLEVRKLDNTAHKTMAMLHSGPSHGGKGHKSQTQHAPIPRQLKQSVPSNP
ncbi:hypothetical protein LR48_Vigan02g241500 [Vigna angularis]|uniref:Uncharacterized protein n=1 Tax=Phaseolus angularis TaxID=3914 RepID=A0A0L9U0E9_PHAAN|nr:hypothetical protein LR48_Vigan02g241500 [Vigna angularis]